MKFALNAIRIYQWPDLCKYSGLTPLLPIKALALLASATDQGIGDVIARLIGPVGGDAYKVWYLATFGQSCGCSERQSDLNTKYSLTTV